MQIQRVTQISEAHCGAAVLQMLLEAVGVTTDQQMIAAAAEVIETIDEHGMRVDQIALASTRIAPHTQFWYKYYASLEDIKYLLLRGIAIGVEWQGLFYKSLEEEAAETEDENETDYGHYSVVVYFDEETEQLVIVDPYKDFEEQNRVFDTQTFLRRWWDTNEIKNSRTGRADIVSDTHLLFFVTSEDDWLPEEMGFKKFHGVG